MSARELLYHAIAKKAAVAGGGPQPTTNAPPMPPAPANPATHVAGAARPQPKTAGAVEQWLDGLAMRKVAKSIPGRLDGDEVLDKLAAKRKKKSKRGCR